MCNKVDIAGKLLHLRHHSPKRGLTTLVEPGLCHRQSTHTPKAVHGYANEPDMAAAANAPHVCDAVLSIDAWLEWVPSDVNVADLPSRAASTWSESARALTAKTHQRISAQGFGRRTLRLPTADQLDDPMVMMRGALEVAAAVKAGVPF